MYKMVNVGGVLLSLYPEPGTPLQFLHILLSAHNFT